MSDGSIRFEGVEALTAKLAALSPEIRAGALKGLTQVGLDIVADAKTNLRNNGSVVTGYLRASGKVQKSGEDGVDAGFFSSGREGGYAFWVEYGRRAGKFPPLSSIVAWARKKFRLTEQEAKRAGFAIALNIARKGTKPHPFLTPAVSKNRGKILRIVQDAIKKAIDR